MNYYGGLVTDFENYGFYYLFSSENNLTVEEAEKLPDVAKHHNAQIEHFKLLTEGEFQEKLGGINPKHIQVK